MKLPLFLSKEPIFIPLILFLALVWLIPRSPYPGLVAEYIQGQVARLPTVKVDLRPSETFRNRFSTNRTALYIETRPEYKGVATALLLHMTQVVPPEWRFLFIGSEELVHKVNRSTSARHLQKIGKLRLQTVEPWTDQWHRNREINLDEVHDKLLTNISFYDEQLSGVEHLLTFRSHSILCANANTTVNDFLQYDWVGAAKSVNDRWGGYGSLSLRRLSKVREVLSIQERYDENEGRWMSSRMGLLPNASTANSSVERTFAVESEWNERPLGYHVPGDLSPNGQYAAVWNNTNRRGEIFQYCPELKIVMPMDFERFRCDEDIINRPLKSPEDLEWIMNQQRIADEKAKAKAEAEAAAEAARITASSTPSSSSAPHRVEVVEGEADEEPYLISLKQLSRP